MGPPLMDAAWIYGSGLASVYATIVQGRPNGMPAFGKRLSSGQAWQLAAYVRSHERSPGQGRSPGSRRRYAGQEPGAVHRKGSAGVLP